jgi:O-antigen ligase
MAFLLFITGLFLPHGLSSLCFVVFLVAVFLTRKQKPRFLQIKEPFHLLQILLFGLTIASMFWTADQESGWNEVLKKLPFLLVPVAFSGQCSTLAFRRMLDILWAACLFITLLCVASVFYYWEKADPTIYYDAHWLFSYENLASASGIQPVYLSLFINTGFLAWFTNYLYRQPMQWWKLIIPLIFFVMIVMLSSRTGFIAFSFVLLIVLIQIARQSKKVLMVLSVFAGIVFVAMCLISMNRINNSRFTEMLDYRSDYKTNQWGSSALRIEKWKNSIDCFRKFPLAGTGAGDYKNELMNVYRANGFQSGVENGYNSHNQFLQTACTLGVIGIFILLSLFLFLFYHSWKTRNLPLLLLTLVFFVSMITESILERQFGIFLFVVLIHLFYKKEAIPDTKSL